jgi:DNA-(apurinic or apyrimidinic site) lyase
MSTLQEIITKIMNRPKQSKTITFAIKMFGYACDIITKKNNIYPMDISIPIDSRIKKIYSIQFPNQKLEDEKIQQYFQKISEKYNIPPLHLDSILRLDYWNIFVKK